MSRGMSVGGGDGSSEILRLRKELVQARTTIADLQEELQESSDNYVKAIHERNQYREKLNNAKESISKVEVIVESKVKMAQQKEREELAKHMDDNQNLRRQVTILDQEKLQMYQKEQNLTDRINQLTSDLTFFTNNADTRDQIKRIENLRAERDAKEHQIVQGLEKMNAMEHQLEDLAAENRTLRKMAKVPDNYGFDLATLKLNADKKIENYTKLIKVLQEDNYFLETERANLKKTLKQQSMMIGNNTPWDRHPNLTTDQLMKVDSYVNRLINGEANDPSDSYELKKENATLKAQLQALSSKNEETAKNLLNSILTELGLKGDSSAGGSAKLFEKLQNGNEEVKKLIKSLFDILSNLPAGGFAQGSGYQGGPGDQPGGSTGGGIIHNYGGGGSGRFRPPIPNVDVDNDIRSGRSVMFRTEFEVADKDGKLGLAVGEQTRYDVAFLQLQLQEVMELVKRKDEELTTKNQEIDQLYKRIRDYLLVQDQLYKDYVKTEKTSGKLKEEMEAKYNDMNELYRTERTKNEKQSELLARLETQSRSKADGQANPNYQIRCIELTKQNSLLEVNLVKLTRKYQTIAEQEELLRRNFHSIEADLAEKDMHLHNRINKLKVWKAKAIQQIKFLFTKLRLAVPLTEFQSVQSGNDLLKQRNADLIERNSSLAEKVSRLQTQTRKNQEAESTVQAMQEHIDDLQNEYDVVCKRLEQCDPQFKWENAVFTKIASILKRYSLSPGDAFNEFDINRDGKLSREEFSRALEKLKINDLSNNDIDILMNSCDYDGDGTIRTKEFERKLSRYGVKNRTPEEQILLLMIKAFKRSGINSFSKAFSLFDKCEHGTISRDEFKGVFASMKLPNIDELEIDKFIDHFWRDQKAGIDYQAFLRIFQRYQLRLDDEQKQSGNGGGAVYKIPEDVIRMKKRIFDRINQSLSQNGKSLDSFFRRADRDNSREIDLNEFKTLFKNMNIPVVETEIQQIFQSIDFDFDGKLTLPEFMADFKSTVSTETQTLIEREKERYNTEMHRQQYNSRGDDHQFGNVNNIISQGKNQELQLQTRIAILETKEKQMARKYETAVTLANHANQAQLVAQRQFDDLERKWSELIGQHHEGNQKIRDLEEKMRHSIPIDKSVKLQQDNEKLAVELTETRAAMLSYKSMNETISDQVNGLKLVIDKRKDEAASLQQALTEMASQSDDKKRLGKLYYLIMLSRWQEAALCRKYDNLLNENRELRSEAINTEQQLQNTQILHGQAENALQEQIVITEKLRQQIGDNKNVFLSIDKAEEFNQRINFLSDEKSILEDEYFQMRTRFRQNQLHMDEAKAKAENYQELLESLQKSKQSDLSDRLIQMSERLQSMKLAEMRATRELKEVKEKNDYYARLLRTSTESVKNLEEKVAEFESRLSKREEEFRRADNERMRRFFNSRYDDIGGGGRSLSSNEHDISSPNPFRNSPSNFNNARAEQPMPQPKPSIVNRPLTSAYNERGAQSSLESGPNNRAAQASSNNENSQQANLVESKLKRTREELDKAREEIIQKDNTIKKFREWQLADRYLNQDAVMNDTIMSQQNQFNQVHEKESKEMAEAAAQMVKTLQEIIDQKNEQLRNKDHLIDESRKALITQSEKDGIEIARLRQQMSLAAGSTLADLQKIVMANQGGQSNAQQTVHGLKYERLTREELSRSLDEKDQVIRGMEQQLGSQEMHLSQLKNNNQILQDQVQDLQNALEIERQHTELKAKVRELTELRKKMEVQERENKKLTRTITELGAEIQKVMTSNNGQEEGSKAWQMKLDIAKREHQETVNQINSKLNMASQGNKQAKEELKQANIKVQQLTEQINGQKQAQSEAKAKIKQAEDNIAAEKAVTQKLRVQINNLQIQLNQVNDAASQFSYQDLQLQNKKLLGENLLLLNQKVTVVQYNKESKSFEYYGKPNKLMSSAAEGEMNNRDEEITNMEDFLSALKAWLARPENQRLSVHSIFEHMDNSSSKTLSEGQLCIAFNKLGIDLREREKIMLKKYLDQNNINRFEYVPLLREIEGIPQMVFQAVETLKLAKHVVDSQDLTEQQFFKQVDPDAMEMMNFDKFKSNINHMRNEHFQMSNDEIEQLFLHVGKCARTSAVSLKIKQLTEKVFRSLDAVLIHQMREAVRASGRSFDDLVAANDANKDGYLEQKEVEQLLLSCAIAFKHNIFNRIFHYIFNIEKSKQLLTKVSAKVIKFVIGPDAGSGSAALASVSNVIGGSNYDMHPQRENPVGGVTQVELEKCRSGARKILRSFDKKLREKLDDRDRDNEGMIPKEAIEKMIVDERVNDLHADELHSLMKYLDPGFKGYIVTEKFVEKLQDLQTETKQESVLRTFALACKRQSINLRQELGRFDQRQEKRIEKPAFIKCLTMLSLQLTQEHMQVLFQAGESVEMQGMLDVTKFIDLVKEASKYSPLAAASTQQTATQKKGQTSQGGGGESQSWEIEKKYKSKFAALQQQIEESKRETEKAEQQARDWKKKANEYEQEVDKIAKKLLEVNAKPPRLQTVESNGQAQIEMIQQLKDQVFHLQEERQKLEKHVAVELRAEMRQGNAEKEKLIEKNKHLNEDIRRLQEQIERILRRPEAQSATEKREELEFYRERRIQELEKDMLERDKIEAELQEQMFKAEEKILDLRFEKETFDLQFARLQKRNTDLEQYKLASAKYSSVLKNEEAAQRQQIAESAGQTAATFLGIGADGKREDKDSVRLKQKATKSVAELELLVESLKRVIEKQKTEADALKKQVEVQEQRTDKLKSEKQLRQRIETLEQELHAYEMKDVNVDEKDRTIQKLIQTNKQLRQDLDKELERFALLETKYKDLLVKFSRLAKDTAKFEQMLFNKTTGGNLDNFDKFLSSEAFTAGAERPTTSGTMHKNINHLFDHTT